MIAPANFLRPRVIRFDNAYQLGRLKRSVDPGMMLTEIASANHSTANLFIFHQVNKRSIRPSDKARNRHYTNVRRAPP